MNKLRRTNCISTCFQVFFVNLNEPFYYIFKCFGKLKIYTSYDRCRAYMFMQFIRNNIKSYRTLSSKVTQEKKENFLGKPQKTVILI